jgi:hypothetical protein
MSTTFYVPPEGILFRIVGYASQCAIFSRNSPEPQVGHYNVSHGNFADQWFSLLHGELLLTLAEAERVLEIAAV